MDRTPLDTAQILLEKANDDLALTGDREKLLQLVGLNSGIGKELVVEGLWYTVDGIGVRISSALVLPAKAAPLARKLTREEPMIVGLPIYSDSEDDLEYLRGEKKAYLPWIVSRFGEARLDEHDPFGDPCANFRPRIARDYALTLSLTTNDRFGRTWQDKHGVVAVRAQAWGREDSYGDGGSHSGLRLLCSASSLKKILNEHDKELLLLIALTRYEKEGYRGNTKYINTVSVVRISKTLDLEYFKGCVNLLHKSRF